MVEHRIQDPQVLPIPDAPERLLGPRGGRCLLCGEWVDDDEEAYDVTIGRGGVAELETLAHPGCLARVAHDPGALPSS